MNNIELSTIYLPMLDEVYKNEAKTSILDGDETTVQKGLNGEIKIAKLDMDALGDFQELRVDRLDNQEALGLPFAKLASEFLRTKVIPEVDAARIAKIAGVDGISEKEETLSDGAGVIAALRACTSKMDEDEVSTENRILFITPTLKGMVDDLDTTKSKKVFERFSTIIEVPQTRMYTEVKLNDGKEAYGYKKNDGASDINFLCVEKSAAVTALDQYIKYFTPDEDQKADDNVFKYRSNNLYGHVYENKLAGVYCSYAPVSP